MVRFIVTELEWTSYQYTTEKKLAGDMCARLEDGHGVFLLNRTQMVFVLEAVKEHCESMMFDMADLMEMDPLYEDPDYWDHIIDVLDVEISELPDPPVYKPHVNILYEGMHKPIVSYDKASNYPDKEER